jgi:hypothetical protein
MANESAVTTKSVVGSRPTSKCTEHPKTHISVATVVIPKPPYNASGTTLGTAKGYGLSSYSVHANVGLHDPIDDPDHEPVNTLT